MSVVILALFSCTEEVPEIIETEAPVSLMSINLSGNKYEADHGRQLKHNLTGIFVTIKQISILKDNEWIKISGDFPQLVNLIELSNKECLLASQEVEPGKYSEIKFDIEQGNDKVVVEGKGCYVKNEKGFIFSLKVPSSKIKVKGEFEVQAGLPHKLILDFDITESIIQLGNKEEYLLKPTIKLKMGNNIGFIRVVLADSFPKGKYKLLVYESGNLVKENLVTKNAQTNSSILFSAKINKETENIIVPNLLDGKYDIYLAADSNDSSLSDKILTGVLVKSGIITKAVFN